MFVLTELKNLRNNYTKKCNCLYTKKISIQSFLKIDVRLIEAHVDQENCDSSETFCAFFYIYIQFY